MAYLNSSFLRVILEPPVQHTPSFLSLESFERHLSYTRSINNLWRPGCSGTVINRSEPTHSSFKRRSSGASFFPAAEERSRLNPDTNLLDDAGVLITQDGAAAKPLLARHRAPMTGRLHTTAESDYESHVLRARNVPRPTNTCHEARILLSQNPDTALGAKLCRCPQINPDRRSFAYRTGGSTSR
ncbi:hypothetical protein BV22DRAFT_383537 [Leucogyrophana mollusca]|uniref:Uncharacterized protein n=1 Tax=Leucogyrophana mollusca TaxID=85980 RepID=A0ACB8BL93_9AGAM|nr:hypothetical protein BV22DRAFT_383537 [Leucogyrophana mollusca]